jgi:hypothetical protein
MTYRLGGVEGMVAAEEKRTAAHARWDPSRQSLEGRARGGKTTKKSFTWIHIPGRIYTEGPF